jgi:hypothetical protein
MYGVLYMHVGVYARMAGAACRIERDVSDGMQRYKHGSAGLPLVDVHAGTQLVHGGN